MNQHWDNLYSQTQDLYGISPNHFIQQIADQVPIVGKTLAIAEGEGGISFIWLIKRNSKMIHFQQKYGITQKLLCNTYLQKPNKQVLTSHLEILISMMSNGQESVIKM